MTLGERGAYPLLRLTFSGGLVYHRAWLRHAPLEVISEPASVDLALGTLDGRIVQEDGAWAA